MSTTRVPRAGDAGGHGSPEAFSSRCGLGGTIRLMSRLDRITTDPAVCHGKPTVRGLRYPVEMLLELLASGMTIDEIVEDYPDLERDDLLAALEFGALAARGRITPLGAA